MRNNQENDAVDRHNYLVKWEGRLACRDCKSPYDIVPIPRSALQRYRHCFTDFHSHDPVAYDNMSNASLNMASYLSDKAFSKSPDFFIDYDATEFGCFCLMLRLRISKPPDITHRLGDAIAQVRSYFSEVSEKGVINKYEHTAVLEENWSTHNIVVWIKKGLAVMKVVKMLTKKFRLNRFLFYGYNLSYKSRITRSEECFAPSLNLTGEQLREFIEHASENVQKIINRYKGPDKNNPIRLPTSVDLRLRCDRSKHKCTKGPETVGGTSGSDFNNSERTLRILNEYKPLFMLLKAYPIDIPSIFEQVGFTDPEIGNAAEEAKVWKNDGNDVGNLPFDKNGSTNLLVQKNPKAKLATKTTYAALEPDEGVIREAKEEAIIIPDTVTVRRRKRRRRFS